MKRLLDAFDTGRYGILLTHNPLCFPVYARWGADLTLSGHVHGGMIRLPILGGLLSPEREFFPKYSAGIYGEDDKKLLVSRGLGSGVFGARIFNIPEIPVITLHKVD
jgi:predicted MPP superfamily phosphohydrolase